MNTYTARRLCVALLAAAAMSLSAPCQAATGEMPWDRTLIAMQDTLVGMVAPAAIALAFSAAVVLFALGVGDKLAGRLIGCALGGCSALLIVHLLNYVLP